MTRETSLLAYERILASGLAKGLRLRISEVLSQNGPMTVGEVWKEYFPRNQRSAISPRFGELESMGIIRQSGTKSCITGESAIVWALTECSSMKQLPKRPSKNQQINQLRQAIKDVRHQIQEGYLASSIVVFIDSLDIGPERRN